MSPDLSKKIVQGIAMSNCARYNMPKPCFAAIDSFERSSNMKRCQCNCDAPDIYVARRVRRNAKTRDYQHFSEESQLFFFVGESESVGSAGCGFSLKGVGGSKGAVRACALGRAGLMPLAWFRRASTTRRTMTVDYQHVA